MRTRHIVAVSVISIFCCPGTSLADDYQILAESVASPLYHSFDASAGAFEDAQAVIRSELALQRVKFLSETDNGIADVRSSVVAALEACHSTYEEIRSLDSQSPDYSGIAMKTLQASPAMYRAANRALSEPQTPTEMEDEERKENETVEGEPPQDREKPIEGEEPGDEEELRKQYYNTQPNSAQYDPMESEMSREDEEDINALAGKVLQEIIKAGFNAYELSSKRDEYRDQYRNARSASLALREVAERRYQSQRECLYDIGIAVEFKENRAIISSVAEDSEAFKNDIRVGDELLSIDEVQPPANEEPTVSSGIDNLVLGLLSNSLSEYVAGDVMTSERRDWLARFRGEYGSQVKLSLMREGDLLLAREVTRTQYSCDKPNFHLDYTGSWHATFDSDIAWFRNDSGRDLTDVTIFVTLYGVHGADRSSASDRHMHYVSRWPAGEYRMARYAASSLDGIISNEAVDTVQTIRVEVYSQELKSILDFSYANTKEIDDDLEQLWSGESRPQITGSFATDNFFGNAAAYLYLDGGLNSMPAPTATVTLTEGERVETETFYPSSNVWRTGNFNCLKFQSEAFNDMDPDSMTVELSFPDTAYKPSLSFTFND